MGPNLESALSLTYLHIELDTHETIMAEGLAVETFLRNNPHAFDNADEYIRLYGSPGEPLTPLRRSTFTIAAAKSWPPISAAPSRRFAISANRSKRSATACLILTGEREPRGGHREVKFAVIRVACLLSCPQTLCRAIAVASRIVHGSWHKTVVPFASGQFYTDSGRRCARRSAVASANVESRGGISPPRAPRHVREPLDSYGSRCSAGAMT